MIISPNFKVAFGEVFSLVSLVMRCVFQFHAHAHDVVVVLKEFCRFLMNHVFHRIRKGDVDAGDDDVLIFHISRPWLCGCG